jgi:hypothetical protein
LDAGNGRIVRFDLQGLLEDPPSERLVEVTRDLRRPEDFCLVGRTLVVAEAGNRRLVEVPLGFSALEKRNVLYTMVWSDAHRELATDLLGRTNEALGRGPSLDARAQDIRNQLHVSKFCVVFIGEGSIADPSLLDQVKLAYQCGCEFIVIEHARKVGCLADDLSGLPRQLAVAIATSVPIPFTAETIRASANLFAKHLQRVQADLVQGGEWAELRAPHLYNVLFIHDDPCRRDWVESFRAAMFAHAPHVTTVLGTLETDRREAEVVVLLLSPTLLAAPPRWVKRCAELGRLVLVRHALEAVDLPSQLAAAGLDSIETTMLPLLLFAEDHKERCVSELCAYAKVQRRFAPAPVRSDKNGGRQPKRFEGQTLKVVSVPDPCVAFTVAEEVFAAVAKPPLTEDTVTSLQSLLHAVSFGVGKEEVARQIGTLLHQVLKVLDELKPREAATSLPVATPVLELIAGIANAPGLGMSMVESFESGGTKSGLTIVHKVVDMAAAPGSDTALQLRIDAAALRLIRTICEDHKVAAEVPDDIRARLEQEPPVTKSAAVAYVLGMVCANKQFHLFTPSLRRPRYPPAVESDSKPESPGILDLAQAQDDTSPCIVYKVQTSRIHVIRLASRTGVTVTEFVEKTDAEVLCMAAQLPNMVVVGLSTDVANVWAIDEGRKTHVVCSLPHGAAVLCVSTFGPCIATGAADKVVRLWRSADDGKTYTWPKIRDTNINDIPYSYSGSFSAVSKPNFASKS